MERILKHIFTGAFIGFMGYWFLRAMLWFGSGMVDIVRTLIARTEFDPMMVMCVILGMVVWGFLGIIQVVGDRI